MVILEGGNPSLLEADALAFLERRGEPLAFEEGAVILRRGETGDAFWVVLSGEVEIRVRSGHEGHDVLTRLGPGETFGELAILRSAPVAADVVSITAVEVLRYPAAFLPNALAECEPLRRSLLTRLAHNQFAATTGALGLFKRTQALADLYESAPPGEAFIAGSARMRAVQASIEGAAEGRGPVLITGELGTGKLLASRMIHAPSRRRDAPLISVDCRELSGRDAGELLFGAEVEQDFDTAGEHFGALHLAHRGTLVLRGVDALGQSTQLELARHLEADRAVERRPFPDVRLIATMIADSAEAASGRLIPELEAQFARVIHLPTLAERPRDIIPLARSFIREFDPTGAVRLSKEAEDALVSIKYRHRNVDELRSIIELAVRVADGPELEAEHIFSGFDEERPIGIDLSRFWLVRWLVSGGGLRIARLTVAVGFLAIALICLGPPSSPVVRTANGLVWSLWEPVVFGLFLLIGSLWCTVCPLSSTGRLVQRRLSLGLRPPAWMVAAGAWLSAIGFVLILGTEQGFHMASSPFPTSMLLMVLVLSAVVCCVIWQREVWCRHLCPLGRLGVALAPVAPLTVAARRSLCASTCTTHDCYKGNAVEPGCPVFHHPQLVGEAHRCKTCLTCLRSCPHGSTGLYLRPRLRSAWQLVSAESYVVPFALVVFLVAPVMVVAQSGILGGPLLLTISCVAVIGVAALMSRTLGPMLQGRERTTAFTASVACALLVLGWGPLMAYQMDHIPLLHELAVVGSAGSLWVRWLGPELSLVTIARVAFIVFAAVLSATILWNARGRALHSGETVRPSGWWLVVVGCTIYTFGTIFLVI